MQIPYLEGEIRESFDRWLEETLARFSPSLTFTEIRKGVQALSEIYVVERREDGRMAARAIDGQGKRAALATYYAALHFLAVHHALVMLGEESLGTVRRIHDLGCGSGASGAAAAMTLGGVARLVAYDRSGWALDEARQTYRSFGLESHMRRDELPKAFPQTNPGDLLCFGWVISELENKQRLVLLKRLRAAAKRHVPLLILEALSTRITPWWADWEDALTALGVRSEIIRVAIERPYWIQDMDKAARLDHQVIGARVLAGPSA